MIDYTTLHGNIRHVSTDIDPETVLVAVAKAVGVLADIGEYFHAHNARAGDALRIAEALIAAESGVVFEVYEEPSADPMGVVVWRHPAFPMFVADCDSEGEPRLTYTDFTPPLTAGEVERKFGRAVIDAVRAASGAGI